MKQLTCGSCGASQSVDEGDLPLGAKEVACDACGAAISLAGVGLGLGPALAAFDAELDDDAIELNEVEALATLSAPQPGLELEAEELHEQPTLNEIPAPNKTAFGIAAGPAPRDLGNLPAPKGPPAGFSDLPAPKGAAPTFGNLPAPKSPLAGLGDLPAPKGPLAGLGDLPAPKGAAPTFGNLPAPKSPLASVGDLPAPKSPLAGFGDLPAPKGAAPTFGNLPTPKGPSAPPAGNPALDVLDLPSPVAHNMLAPKPDTGPAASPADLFSDLPLPTLSGARSPLAGVGGLDLLGDLPKPAAPLAPSGGKPLDLDDLDLEQPSTPAALTSQANAAAAASGAAPKAPPPNLDLGDFGGLDLPGQSPGGGHAGPQQHGHNEIKQSPSGGGGSSGGGLGGSSQASTAAPTITAAKGKQEIEFGSSTDDLDLALGDESKQTAPAFGTAGSKKKPKGDAPDGPSTKVDISSGKGKAALSTKARLVTAGLAVLALLVIGGGIFGYLKYSAGKARDAKIANLLADARTELRRGNKGHWDKATAIAREVLELAPTNADALGVAAQGLLAGYLDEGTDGARRLGQAKTLISQMATAQGNEIELAQALKLLALDVGQGDRALQRLATVVTADPANTQVALYQGWAYLAARQWKAAQGAFDRALAAAPERQTPELIGRADAKVMLGDREGARADYTKVLEQDKDHIGAQVGLAAAMPPSDYARRESDLVALLARPDIDKADARAVLKAWTLAADEAVRAGRLEVAADRYRKALAISADDFAATLGLARLALRQGRPVEAERQVMRALERDGKDIEARMVHVETLIDLGKPNEARGVMDALVADANATTNASTKSRVLILRGEMLEAEGGKPDEIIALYQEAVATAETGDYGPPVGAANGLGRLAMKADEDKQPELAKQYRAKAEEFLSAISSLANNDPATALTLGVAYTTTGAPARGEEWLRKALASRPGDIETNFQLAVALSRQGKRQEAINVFAKTFAMDGSRLDVGLQYAMELEIAARDGEAGDLYAKLVASRDVTLDIRARAGRFWARQGDIDKAKEQGDEIFAAAPDYPAGFFLRAEGLLKAGKLEEARRLFSRATEDDGEAQYFDGLGRACETLGADGDLRFKDEAIRAYGKAAEIDPKMVNSLAGMGRLYLERADYEKALTAFKAADALRGGDSDILFGMGAALQGLRKFPEALAALTRSVASKPQALTYYKIAQVNRDLERSAAAAAAYGNAVRMGVELETTSGKKVEWLSEAMWMSGFSENQLGNDGASCRSWKLFIARNPTDTARVNEATRAMMGFRGCL